LPFFLFLIPIFIPMLRGHIQKQIPQVPETKLCYLIWKKRPLNYFGDKCLLFYKLFTLGWGVGFKKMAGRTKIYMYIQAGAHYLTLAFSLSLTAQENLCQKFRRYILENLEHFQTQAWRHLFLPFLSLTWCSLHMIKNYLNMCSILNSTQFSFWVNLDYSKTAPQPSKSADLNRLDLIR